MLAVLVVELQCLLSFYIVYPQDYEKFFNP
jgi:hypothetical protein